MSASNGVGRSGCKLGCGHDPVQATGRSRESWSCGCGQSSKRLQSSRWYLAKSPVYVGDAPAGYWVQARRPETRETTEESFAHIRDAIARATELIRAGYSVEIRSAAPPAS
jgi:hypothetical protein